MPDRPPRGSRVCIHGETLLFHVRRVCHCMGGMGGVGADVVGVWVCARAVALAVAGQLGPGEIGGDILSRGDCNMCRA